MLVSVFGPGQGVFVRIDIVVSLGFAGNAIYMMKTGIEPLGRIGCGNLISQHITKLVIKNPGIIA